MRTVRSWKKYRFIGFSLTMREEIDKAWTEPQAWEDGKAAAQAYVPLLEAFMQQREQDRMAEAAGNAFYLLERLGRLYCEDISYFEPNKACHCSFYEFLLEAVCHILAMVMIDKRTEKPLSNSMTWQLSSINMLYGQIFMSSYTKYQDLMYGEVTENSFAFGYDYLDKGVVKETQKTRVLL